MNKQRLFVSITMRGVNICENVPNGKKPYTAVLADELSPKQALKLGLQLLKAAFQMGQRP
jgi:hypothetical protein